MDVLIKSGTIVDPGSRFSGKVMDILIRSGHIREIKKKLPGAKGVKVYQATGQFVSPGWFDMHVNIGEPGYETKESFDTGLAAAAAGGFTGIAMMPNTQPPLYSKSQIEYVKRQTQGLPVDVYPVGTISYKREGKDLAEMFDMFRSGAIAFSDGDRPVTDAGLMLRAQQYVKGFGSLLIAYPEDQGIAGGAKVNEGSTSTLLGMKGIPNLAEDIIVARDLFLAEYNNARVHFTTVSTAGGVELIRAARKKGVKVTADVAAHHLLLDDSRLEGFDSNYKVKPPLRSKADVKALKDALKEGVIDAVCSQHTPHEIEYKQVEFEIAAYGISALETAYAVLNMAFPRGMSAAQMVEKLAVNPRRILGIQVPVIEAGQPANLTLFDPDHTWELKTGEMRSKGKNSPFAGQKLKGKATAIYNNGQLIINN